jgi:hypothetical protein
MREYLKFHVGGGWIDPVEPCGGYSAPGSAG